YLPFPSLELVPSRMREGPLKKRVGFLVRSFSTLQIKRLQEIFVTHFRNLFSRSCCRSCLNSWSRFGSFSFHFFYFGLSFRFSLKFSIRSSFSIGSGFSVRSSFVGFSFCFCG